MDLAGNGTMELLSFSSWLLPVNSSLLVVEEARASEDRRCCEAVANAKNFLMPFGGDDESVDDDREADEDEEALARVGWCRTVACTAANS